MSSIPTSGFPYYIYLAANVDPIAFFSSDENVHFLASISEERSQHRYAPGKWSIRQLIGHITDHERVMTYRALRFSRKDTTPLPGYNQDVLVNHAYFDDISYHDLLEDFKCVRMGTRSFVKQLRKEQFSLKGTASDVELTVDDALRIIIGHELHHLKIIRERYL